MLRWPFGRSHKSGVFKLRQSNFLQARGPNFGGLQPSCIEPKLMVQFFAQTSNRNEPMEFLRSHRPRGPGLVWLPEWSCGLQSLSGASPLGWSLTYHPQEWSCRDPLTTVVFCSSILTSLGKRAIHGYNQHELVVLSCMMLHESVSHVPHQSSLRTDWVQLWCQPLSTAASPPVQAWSSRGKMGAAFYTSHT